jgi:hypothetical protein
MKMTRGRGFNTTTARLLCTLGAAALFLSSSGMALASTVGFDPETSPIPPEVINVGDTFIVDIVGSDFAELAGGVIDLMYNTNGQHIVDIDNVVVNPYFDFEPDPGGPAVGDSPTTWSGIGFDTLANDPATGNFTVATITLRAAAPGTTSLEILSSSEFFSSTEQLFPTLLDGTVHVVPVPAAVWLFGSGLLGLIGVARKKAAS